MFDNVADRYDFLNHLLSMGIDILWRKKTINSIQSINPKVILDVATGTGDLAIETIRLKPEKIIGLDLSQKMLDLGIEKVKRKKLDHIIGFQKGDSEDLPFENNSFDAITVAYGVRNFENLDTGLSEMFRVLKPGGRLAVLEFSKPTMFPVKQFFNFYFQYVCPLIGKMFSDDDRAYTYLPESVKVFPVGNDFVNRLEKAGFKKTKCRQLSFGISSLYNGEK